LVTQRNPHQQPTPARTNRRSSAATRRRDKKNGKPGEIGGAALKIR
jgi:hypothetical protein